MSVPFDFEAVLRNGKVLPKTFRSWGVGDKKIYASNCAEQLQEEYEWAIENGVAPEDIIGFQFYWEGNLCQFNFMRRQKTK